MGVGQPGVEGEHRHLDGEADEEGQGHEGLVALGLLGNHRGHRMEAGQGEVIDARGLVLQEVDGQERHQHQHRAGQGVEEELDGRIQLLGAAPDADEEVHGDQHHFPEEVEEEHVLGDEDAQHGGLEHQQPEVVLLVPLLDGPEGAGHRDGADEGGQQPEQEADAVHAHAELDPEGRDPAPGPGPLDRIAGPVVAEPEREAQQEAGDHDHEGADLKDPALLLGYQEQDQTAHKG